ncbi:hypothetical protein J7384_03595 [Endozoicomonas sp. G2_1]|uniref:hypothetical protein n=1 Tax=Endozoicomonas sp. G2_1 TaxID=2821091 RepID=UPI001ADBA855|nr:hypothetical protein [Endozoicomonas sp. G2_1]MBO9489439.1 hypothetical protein [Endozoicomonas sp. G2_1]
MATEPDNLDLVYAQKIFYQQDSKTIHASFARSVIERADELRFMPDNLFNHYGHYFTDYVVSFDYPEFDGDMVADCFLNLLSEKFSNNSVISAGLLQKVEQVLHFFAENISFFQGERDIYGDLSERLEATFLALESYQSKRQ